MLIFSLLFLKITLTAQAGESIIGVGEAPYNGNLEQARIMAKGLALEDVFLRLFEMICPYPQTIVEKMNPLDFVQAFSIVDENLTDTNYRLQIEVEPDWDKLANFLKTQGIITTGHHEKVLLFLDLPEDIDLKTPTLSFFKKFFLLFKLTPIYDSQIKQNEVLDFASNQAIPLVFFLKVRLDTSSENSQFKIYCELLNVNDENLIYQSFFNPKVPYTQIEQIVQCYLGHLRQLAHRLTSNLSNWLKQRQPQIVCFKIVFKSPHNYADIFNIWQELSKIKAIRDIYLQEISYKKAVYLGKFQGSFSELVNQIAALGFVLRLKGREIEITYPQGN